MGMASKALERWNGERSDRLDAAAAEASPEGPEGSINQALAASLRVYILFLAAEFQAFCRDLHVESANQVGDYASRGDSVEFELTIRAALSDRKNLDAGNPWPDKLAEDFARFGMNDKQRDLWAPQKQVRGESDAQAGIVERRGLMELIKCRNKVAHGDIEAIKEVPVVADVEGWRACCDRLANDFDEVMRRRIESIVGASPW